MFQDIQPHVLKNQNDQQRAPRSGDYILIGRQQQVLLMNGTLPKYEDIDADYAFSPDQYQYLLAVDQAAFFWVDVDAVANDNYTVGTTRGFRDLTPAWLAFSSATAAHLAWWYDTKRFCGHCGQPLHPGATERSLVCAACGQSALKFIIFGTSVANRGRHHTPYWPAILRTLMRTWQLS